MLRYFDIEDALRSEFQMNNPCYEKQPCNAIDHQYSDLLGHVTLVDGVVVGGDC